MLTAILLSVVGASLVGVTVHFWPRIMAWAREHMLPWVDQNMPQLAATVRQAFMSIDNVMVATRRAIREAWQKLRTVLLGQVAKYQYLAGIGWVIRITTFLRRQEQRERPVVRVVTEQELAWDELPESVRAEAIAAGIQDSEVDIVRVRDELLREAV